MKRYRREPGTDFVRSIGRGRRNLAASRLSAVEVPAALARRVRQGDLPVKEARAHASRVPADLAEMRVVEIRPAVVELAAEIVWRRSLRAYDALQLAAAVRLARESGVAVTFTCSDADLCHAAAQEGLRVHRVG